MSSTLLKKAMGLSSISDLLDKGNIFYNQAANSLPSFDYETAGKHIARENSTWSGLGEHQMGRPAYDVTFSFPTWYGQKKNDFYDNNPYGFNDTQKEQARISLDSWADVANITFREVGPNERADIRFGNITDPNGTFQAYATLPHTYSYGYDVSGQAWFSDYYYAQNTTPELGNYGRHTIVHEIGHTLGLMHPGEYNAGQNVPGYLKSDYAEDSRQYSVMSYWGEYETGANFGGNSAAAPLLHDIAAMHYLYGANYSTRTGDDTYGFNSTTDKDYFRANHASDKLIFSVWDAGGNDTFDFSGFTQDQIIDLRDEHFSDVGGLVKNVSIAKGVVIENAISGFGDDIIIGNDANNTLTGGAGDDMIYGGAGADILWGGSGSDTFVYEAISDSYFATPDRIMDFETGIDKIDLSGLIKNTFTQTPISYVDQFTGNGAELTINQTSANTSEVLINLYGNYYPEFKIDIVGHIEQTDFIV